MEDFSNQEGVIGQKRDISKAGLVSREDIDLGLDDFE
jgi:hypothetical protein